MLRVLRASPLGVALVTEWLSGCGGPPSEPKAATLRGYEEVCSGVSDCGTQCDAGSAVACDAAGLFFELGEGTAQSYERAAELYARACNGEAPGGCYHLGLLSEIGLGGSQDPEAAVALYRRACDAELGEACANLSRMYGEGSGVERDPGQAEQLAARACELGDRSACETSK